MSRYFSQKLSRLKPYVPGEQPKDGQYIKLNTNESPYFPSRYAVDKIGADIIERLRLYSDPDCTELSRAIGEFYGVSPNNVLPTNGSDEALAFCFAAFGESGMIFPDITYGFYKVFGELFEVDCKEVPLNADFTVDTAQYEDCGRTVMLANPNAQTGIYLPLGEIERIVKSNPDNVVVIDEAYIDFGGESAVKLIDKYENLVVVQTFSKSRSLAGARVGFAVANEQLISDLKRVKFSFNPYNVNSVSSALAVEAVKDKAYFDECRTKIMKSRKRLSEELNKIGYTLLPSTANFVLAKSPSMSGEKLYKLLKAKGILVRHFEEPRITDFVRITVGTDSQIDILLSALNYLEAL